ncbi:hypothetical protein AV903_21610 [Erwinia tracheiphila]|uniref:4-alpha-glucanotransferase n=1 Tax=Erwinia tracheiphila TaxID=65700 RepID=A0A345CX39_9GAMM|nr:hypothetical protein AV903_21610 [Erwinia tracheiphila]
MADFQHGKAAQRWWQPKSTQRWLQQARECGEVDYTQVAGLKIQGLRHTWQHFSQRSYEDDCHADFARFIHEGGGGLFWQGTFDALHSAMLREDASRWVWPIWPTELQDVHSEQVQQFCQQNEDDVYFWLWLQWLANWQFDECWQLSQQLKMPPGLYRDLAVGVAEGGARAWCDRELYYSQVSVGAPTDILGPAACRAARYGRASMATVYRFDVCQYGQPWCAAHRSRYVDVAPVVDTERRNCQFRRVRLLPVDDLLAILALESHRNQCMVIGEDLGTVPVEIVAKLRDSGIYSWKVFYFEQDDKERYCSPSDWPRQSMASATPHDLPTLRAFWTRRRPVAGRDTGRLPGPGHFACPLSAGPDKNR